jgi:5-methyltetrahydropteroyltriglutamate--homocysteine methyltransferase
MLSANLSGYPTRPDLKAIREYVRAGGENPFTAGVKKAVQDQLRAGVDIVTDGQVRQVTDLLASNVPGMRMDDHPRIENTVGTPRNTTAELDFITAARECGDATRVKAVLPGPFSFADSCALDAKAPYRSKHDVNLLFDIASVLRYEIDALRENHASLIQITEPIEIVRDLDVFLDLLSVLFKRVKTPVCHFEGNVSKAFPKLLEAKIAVISFDVVDFTQNNATVKFKELVEVHEKVACVGCVNSSKAQVESIEALQKRVGPFIDAFGQERIWISPSNTLANLPRLAAFDKLRQLEAAKRRIAARAE